MGTVGRSQINQQFIKSKYKRHLTIVFRTILALVKSVAVHSMNTFFVFRAIAECAPFMIGGNESTVLTIPRSCK